MILVLFLLALVIVPLCAGFILWKLYRIFGHTVWLAVLTYVAIAVFAFGDVFQPLRLITFWPDRLGAQYWQALVLASFAIGACSFALPLRFALLRGPMFVAVGMTGSLLSVGVYADHLREAAVKRFGADRIVQHSFFESARSAPADLQFFLHAAAMKRCVPYAWSYRTMGFYQVSPSAARNVMPERWLAECARR